MELTDPLVASRATLTAVAVYTTALALFSWRVSLRARIWGATCALAIAAYAYCTSAGTLGGIDSWSAAYRAPTIFLCAALPAVFFGFVAVLFDDAPNNSWRILIVVVVGILGLIAQDAQNSLGSIASVLRRALAIGLIGWSLWILWRGSATDLVRRRLQTRTVLLSVAGVYVAGVLIVELFTRGADVSTGLLAGNLMSVALITMGIGVSVARWDLLRQPRTSAPHPEAGLARSLASTNPTPPTTTQTRQQAIIDRLQLAMNDQRLYRREKLTVAKLANELDTSEHQLRAAINQGLGYRNFSEFLHRYRLDEAAARLADREQAAIPVLTIALEVGYASIGPFNRAFKARFALTPTAYRHQRLSKTPDQDAC